MTSALILIRQVEQLDLRRQLVACMRLLEQAGYTLAGLLQPSAEIDHAAALVRTGAAEVVVVAYSDDELDQQIQQAGGRVEPVYRTTRRTTVKGMIATLYTDEDWAVQRISRTFGIRFEDVVDHLRRSGIRTAK